MKIFLTGGSGFVGSHFINHALSEGYDLICLRRFQSQPRIPLLSNPTWVEGALVDDFRGKMSGCDVLIHLAAHSTNVPYDTLENCLYWNLTATLKLLQNAREAGIKKYLIAGTGFEYGESGEKYEFIPVDAPLRPTMSYPASKAAASIAIYQWTIEYILKLKYLRIFQVFGEGEDENRLWPSLRKSADSGKDFYLTAGEQIRDFTPVKEVVKQLIGSLDFSDVIAGRPLFKNIGTNKPQTTREFAEYWWNKWEAKGQLHFGKIPYRDNEIMNFIPKL